MTSQQSKYDLTTGGIVNKLLLVAVPVIGTQLLQMSYNLTDMFWLGRLSSDAVAASGTGGLFMWLSMAFIMVGRMGAEIGVAQSLGRGDQAGAKRFAQNALWLGLVLGVFYGIALIALCKPFIGFFHIPEAHVVRDAESYLRIVAMPMPFIFLGSVMVGTFVASGNSRTPFLVNACGLAANMVLDPLMIFGLDMGIEGAAYATAISQVISFSLMLFAFKRMKNRPFSQFTFFPRPDRETMRRILRWTVPIGLESMFFTLMGMTTTRFVAGFGADAMAVGRVGSQVESLTWLVGGGFGSALTAFMGQNFGAGRWTRIRKGFRVSLLVMSVYGLLITALMVFCAGFLFSIFLPDPDIIAMGVQYLWITAMCQIPQCLETVSHNTFKGTGRTIPPSVVSLTSNISRVVFAYFLSKTSLGLYGIWLGISLAAVIRGTWSLTWYLIAARKNPAADVAA